MSAFDEFDEKLKKFRASLAELMKEKHSGAPLELQELLSAVTAIGFECLPRVIAQGGAAGVSAIRLVFELSKLLE